MVLGSGRPSPWTSKEQESEMWEDEGRVAAWVITDAEASCVLHHLFLDMEATSKLSKGMWLSKARPLR